MSPRPDGVTRGPAVGTEPAARQAPVCVGQCVHPCETCLENVQARNYELGKVVTLEGLPKLFSERAGTAYAAKRDEDASLYRKLADEFRGQAGEEVKRMESDWEVALLDLERRPL